MTPEIEKRIKAVQAGRVPAGYKRTKVGIVPKEWDELKLSHYLSVSKEKNTELKYSKEDVFSISGELGIVNQIELLGRSYAGVSVAPYGVVKPNDVVYTKSPLKANPYGIIKTNKTGKTGIVSTLYAIFNCKNNVNPIFVQYYFESDKNLNDYLHPIVNIGAKHDMKISDENSLSGIVVFPSLSEQKKIAEILATQDRVIELKEKLIAEKQSQKKYLMQYFFKEKQKKCTIVKFHEMFSRVIRKNEENNQNVLTISAQCGLVSQNDFFSKSIASEDKTNYFLLNKGEFAYNKSYSNGYPFGTLKRLEKYDKGIVSPLYICFAAKPNNKNPNFFVHYFEAGLMNKEIKSFAQEGARNHGLLNISVEDFFNSNLYIPSLSEQKVIADVLSAADEEIFLLQKDLEQEKLKKKSLMQLLLTGLVRVQ